MSATDVRGLFQLPYEVLIQILEEFTLHELLVVSRVSRRLNAATQEPALWVRFLEERPGIQLREGVRGRIVAIRTAPGLWDGKKWTPRQYIKDPASPPPFSFWELPWHVKSYFEKLIWPPLPPKVLDQPDPRDTEVPIGPTIPVHFPTLFRSRCYIEEEMRLQGPHRRWRPNEADDPLDEEQDASVEDEDVFPNFMVSMGMHSLIVYVVRVKHQWIVSGSRDHSFKIWRIPEMEMDGSDPMYGSEVVHTEAAHESSVIALEFEVEDAFNPGKGLIVTGSSDHTVKVWEVEWGHEAAKGWEGIIVTLKATLAGHSRTVTGIGITDKYLVTCSHDLRVFIYDRQSIYSSKTVAVLHEASVSVPNGGFPTGLALSPDKTKVSLAGYEGSNVFVDLPSGEVTIEQQPPAHTSHIYSVDWVEGLHGCGGCGGTVQLTQTQPRRFVTWAGRATSFRTMRLVPELNLVMCAGHNGIIQTWPYNFSASRETETVEGPMRVYNFPDPQPIYSIDRSGTYLVAAAGRCVYFIVHGVGKPYANLF